MHVPPFMLLFSLIDMLPVLHCTFMKRFVSYGLENANHIVQYNLTLLTVCEPFVICAIFTNEHYLQRQIFGLLLGVISNKLFQAINV